jgi:hypothetical protein
VLPQIGGNEGADMPRAADEKNSHRPVLSPFHASLAHLAHTE